MNRKNIKRLNGFADRLDTAINIKNISYAELSRQLDCNVKSIYGWRDGLYEPCAFDLAKLCLLLNVSPNYLLFGKEELEGILRNDRRRTQAY